MAKYRTLVQDHLVIPARVGLPTGQERELRRRGIPVPDSVGIRLLIDTGSKRTTLIPGIIRHLRLIAEGSARLIAARGSGTTDLFWVGMDFPEAGLAPFPEVLVARLPMPSALGQFHGLLGRDLLRRLESFEYEGRHGCYSIRDRAGLLTWFRRWL
jgi:hypothetical protein